MYRKMLLPLDGSELAEEIMPYAEETAAILRLNVVLLNVVDSSEREISMHQEYIKVMANRMRAELGHMEQKREREGDKIHVESYSDKGHPAEKIIRYADRNNIDFIMISPFGQYGDGRWSMGGTAEKITRSSRVPIWIVRSRDSKGNNQYCWPVKKILVPLDGSSLGECVLTHLTELSALARTKHAEIILLNVVEPILVNADYPEAVMSLSWQEHVKHQINWLGKGAREYLNKVKMNMEKTGLVVNTEIKMGDPFKQILKYVHDNSIDLIVMATHGGTGIARFEYGTVADRVVHNSTVPVFLVRPEQCYIEAREVLSKEI